MTKVSESSRSAMKQPDTTTPEEPVTRTLNAPPRTRAVVKAEMAEVSGASRAMADVPGGAAKGIFLDNCDQRYRELEEELSRCAE